MTLRLHKIQAEDLLHTFQILSSKLDTKIAARGRIGDFETLNKGTDFALAMPDIV